MHSSVVARCIPGRSGGPSGRERGARSSALTVSKLGPMAGTLMVVDPSAPKVQRFIAMGGEPYIIRYNSRLPVVVYAPEGVEVRYRIWSAEPETKAMEKG
jgi:serine protease inhibitor ecotin